MANGWHSRYHEGLVVPGWHACAGVSDDVIARSPNSREVPARSVKDEPSCASLDHQFLFNLTKRQRVDHVLSAKPAFPGSPDAED